MRTRTAPLAARLRETVLRHARAKAPVEPEMPTAESAAVTVDLLTGTVLVHGAPSHLAPSELSVILALAVRDRPVSRDELADDLFPSVSQSANTLKVAVHRVRRRLGIPEAIRHEAGRYALGWCVDVDLPRVVARVRAMRRDGFQGPPGPGYLLAIRDRLAQGRPACTRAWGWFEPTDRALSQLWYEITMMLAQDALGNSRYDEAFQLTSELLTEDPVDEMAAEIAIRASVLCHDRIGAFVQYRQYASALQRELGEPPPDAMHRLIKLHAG